MRMRTSRLRLRLRRMATDKTATNRTARSKRRSMCFSSNYDDLCFRGLRLKWMLSFPLLNPSFLFVLCFFPSFSLSACYTVPLSSSLTHILFTLAHSLMHTNTLISSYPLPHPLARTLLHLLTHPYSYSLSPKNLSIHPPTLPRTAICARCWPRTPTHSTRAISIRWALWTRERCARKKRTESSRRRDAIAAAITRRVRHARCVLADVSMSESESESESESKCILSLEV
jgi:hypothetical protein